MGPNTTGDIGDILCVWAHPDDEAYLSAGLMMRAIETGHRVVCVTATKGEAGFPDDDPRTVEERMAVRERELAACLTILGITEHHWMGYPDGGCADVPDEEAAAALAGIIAEVRPDTVLAFAPEGGTGHSDHIATCRWATRAVELAALPGTQLLYSTRTQRWIDECTSELDLSLVMMADLEVERCDESELAIWFTTDGDLWDRKVAALRAQASQVEPFAQHMGLDWYRAFVREEFFRAPRDTDPELIERSRYLGRT